MLGASIDPLLSLLDTYWVSRCLGMLSLAALGPALNVEDNHASASNEVFWASDSALQDWMFDILKTVQVPVRSLTSESAAAGRPREVQETLSQAAAARSRAYVNPARTSPVECHTALSRLPRPCLQALCFCWRIGLAVVAWLPCVMAVASFQLFCFLSFPPTILRELQDLI